MFLKTGILFGEIISFIQKIISKKMVQKELLQKKMK